MDKKGETPIGLIIMLAFTAIVAIALFVAVINEQNLLTDKQTDTNKSFDVSSASTGGLEVDSTSFTILTQSAWKEIECPLTSVALRNGVSTALVDNTDYVLWEANGTFTLLNTSKTAPDTSLNITYVDYTFCADGYNTDSGSRSIAGLISLFLALALLAAMFLGIKNELFK